MWIPISAEKPVGMLPLKADRILRTNLKSPKDIKLDL